MCFFVIQKLMLIFLSTKINIYLRILNFSLVFQKLKIKDFGVLKFEYLLKKKKTKYIYI